MANNLFIVDTVVFDRDHPLTGDADAQIESFRRSLEEKGEEFGRVIKQEPKSDGSLKVWFDSRKRV